MTIGTRIFTWLRGREVGSDDQGNRYFEERQAVAGRHKRRWVLYNGTPEASRVPPEWHAWLHYTTATPIAESPEKPWIEPHQQNLTGSDNAYLPPGHELRGGERPAVTGDYEAWQP